jgi:hypothetical protein
MPKLRTQTQETFARLCAEGVEPEEAMGLAGYTHPSPAKARALIAKPSVTSRIEELRVPGASPPTVGSLTRHLIRVAIAAEAQGNATALSVARSAWMDVARLNNVKADEPGRGARDRHCEA